MSHDPAVTTFIARWSHAQSAERANYALFLTELCDILDVPHPDPAGSDTENNAYVFERAVPLHQRDGKTTTGRIDLYKRGCFVLEAKQYATAPGDATPSSLSAAAAQTLSPSRSVTPVPPPGKAKSPAAPRPGTTP